MPEMIKVLKCNLEGEVTWQYEGTVLRRAPGEVTLEASFNRTDMPFMGVTLKQGDRFVETFYTGRWYNIFEIFDRDGGRLKGWYCNIGKPALLGKDFVSYVDLALDLWVAAEGEQTVLDEDEFSALPLSEQIRGQARAALGELRSLFTEYCASRRSGSHFFEYAAGKRGNLSSGAVN